MTHIDVRTQEQLDAIDADYRGLVRICGGTRQRPISLTVHFHSRPFAVGSAVVCVRKDAWIAAKDRAHIRAYDNADVVAKGRAFVAAKGRAKVSGHDECRIRADGKARVTAFGKCHVLASGRVRATLRGHSTAVATGDVQLALRQTCSAWMYSVRILVRSSSMTCRIVDRTDSPVIRKSRTSRYQGDVSAGAE